MNRYIAYVMLFIMCGCFTSCTFYRLVTGKSKGQEKKIVIAVPDTNKIVTPVPPPVIPKPDTVAVKAPDTAGSRERQLIAQAAPLWKSRLVYRTFTGKAKMKFDGPDTKQEFTAHIRVRKDSAIWINITAALGGISVARVFITTDSFFMLNYLAKEITRLPLTAVAKILPAKVDFFSLQNLIVGEPLRGGDITGAGSAGDSLVIQVEDSGYVQQIVYNKADSTMRTGRLRTHNPCGPLALTEYSGYMATGNGKVSTGRSLDLHNGNDVYSLDMNFSKIDFDLPLEFPFSIPENYTVKQ